MRFNYPDPSKEGEVDLIAHSTGSYVIQDENELPKWERKLRYSGNYKLNYSDEFSFVLHGIENNTPEILRNLRNNRTGYICEIITTGNKSFVFQAPVFLNAENTKPIDSHSWNVSLGYRVPTFQDRLIKLNTILMTNNYILTGGNTIWSGGNNNAIIGS